MRFLSSSALASAEKLRLAASCSAAETMGWKLRVEYSRQAAPSPTGRLGARMVTEPPACSTAATADFEAPQTEKATLLLMAPEPSNRTPSFARLSTPAFTSASTSTVEVASSLPAL